VAQAQIPEESQMNESLRKMPPRWLTKMQPQNLPPAPCPGNPIEAALDDYQSLRDNYVAAISQITELHDICREQCHRIEVMESLQTEERQFYKNEIECVVRQRDILAAFSSRLETRLTAINELINGAMHEALSAADGANKAHQHSQEAHPDSEQDEFGARQIVQSIARANPPEDGLDSVLTNHWPK
jgi:hypothetical protein